MDGVSLVENAGAVTVRIPMQMKKRGGRKEIHVPEGLDATIQKTCYGNAFAIALARAHAWMDMLDSGKYRSIREMADSLGLCQTYVTRLLRFTLLAPDIIQAILDSKEPDGFSQNKLVGEIPADWTQQRREWGFQEQ